MRGPVRLAEDVEALVLDPCLRGTDIEQVAGASGLVVRWHAGFRLELTELARAPRLPWPALPVAGCRAGRRRPAGPSRDRTCRPRWPA
ncbi:MAG: DUF3626 domain-containing protein [Jatrophihabitantaceae bacterium]